MWKLYEPRNYRLLKHHRLVLRVCSLPHTQECQRYSHHLQRLRPLAFEMLRAFCLQFWKSPCNFQLCNLSSVVEVFSQRLCGSIFLFWFSRCCSCAVVLIALYLQTPMLLLLQVLTGRVCHCHENHLFSTLHCSFWFTLSDPVTCVYEP